MSEHGARTVAAIARLRAALEQTAASLANPRLDALLAGEAEIEIALSEIGDVDVLSAEERRTVRAEVEAAAGALLRCRRLGAALDDFVRTTLYVQGRAADYGPRKSADATYAGQALDARV